MISRRSTIVLCILTPSICNPTLRNKIKSYIAFMGYWYTAVKEFIMGIIIVFSGVPNLGSNLMTNKSPELQSSKFLRITLVVHMKPASISRKRVEYICQANRALKQHICLFTQKKPNGHSYLNLCTREISLPGFMQRNKRFQKRRNLRTLFKSLY